MQYNLHRPKNVMFVIVAHCNKMPWTQAINKNQNHM